MQPKSNLMNSAMLYGLYLGVAFSANFLFSQSQNTLLSLLHLPVLILIIYFTYKFAVNFRNNEPGGTISYGRAFTFVMMMHLFASIISAAVKFIFFRFIKTDYLSELMNLQLEMLETIMPDNFPEESVEMMYKLLETFQDPLNFSLFSILNNFFPALIIALIIAGVVKRDRSPFDDQSNFLTQN